MSFLAKLAKIVAFLAICSLLLDRLGQIDLASLGVSHEWKEKIEMVLQAREILKEAVEIIPWGKAVSERSTEIRLAAATPGIVIALVEVILSILRFGLSVLRFLIGVGVLVALVGMAFVYVPALLAGRASSTPTIIQDRIFEYIPTPGPSPFRIAPGSPPPHIIPHHR
jgi:hypothetical protein